MVLPSWLSWLEYCPVHQRLVVQFLSGHIFRFQVQSPVRACTRGNWSMFFSLSKNQSIISFNWPGKTGGFIKRTDLFSLKRLLFLNRALPVSFIGDRFALRSLHQSFISSSLPACPLCTAFVINVEQLKSLTWVQARPVFLWAYSLLS